MEEELNDIENKVWELVREYGNNGSAQAWGMAWVLGYNVISVRMLLRLNNFAIIADFNYTYLLNALTEELDLENNEIGNVIDKVRNCAKIT